MHVNLAAVRIFGLFSIYVFILFHFFFCIYFCCFFYFLYTWEDRTWAVGRVRAVSGRARLHRIQCFWALVMHTNVVRRADRDSILAYNIPSLTLHQSQAASRTLSRC